MNGTVTVEGLSKSFPGTSTPVLDDVNLSVEAGSCTALLGPSGAGKSTLLRAVSGLEVPDAGRVLVGGQDMAGVKPERRGMAMVQQRPLLFPHLNVLDNIAFAGTVRGVPKRTARVDAAEFLDLVQLEGFGRRQVTALSGGQAQRVAIARALAARPSVLLLDEPFSALDPELRSAMHALLAELRRRLNPTILMVTHDRSEAAVVAENIALFSGGRILQHSSVELMYSRPASLEASRLMGGANEIPGTVCNGSHHSALGVLPLPCDTAWPTGPGILLARQESIEVSAADGAGLQATISGLQGMGPRRLVTLDAAGVVLRAEVPWGRGLAVGENVTMHIPTSALAVVDDSDTAHLYADADERPSLTSRGRAALTGVGH
ncbi:putative spermidine/putrescine transport system ATP-binding protein [Arthrobacter silviterrae]|uniref:ABC transporter ATP-binding protein n=1 Tax=Arthrobacter silviterrae TaxID=2026658 RepID=A0ABX0DIF9_9MICC|nr:ABC transporter ATP-binding protein [Arthrobacter silviterrae]MDQ0278836.1 putative spermidine/putrescine transport system ATP-binding protein [Arthrobacter silviterrae]NGN84002.1 ABC transporter ATP-binding protein [Arthrobacter silviterrae]